VTLGVGSRPDPKFYGNNLVRFDCCDSKGQRQFHLLKMKRHTGFTGLAYAGFRLLGNPCRALGYLRGPGLAVNLSLLLPQHAAPRCRQNFGDTVYNSRARRIITISRFSEAYHCPPFISRPLISKGGLFL
jgi:hypothetical protein